jgi:nucleoside-diphosphate-sugar epimerase
MFAAEDVAQCFVQALANRSVSIGEALSRRPRPAASRFEATRKPLRVGSARPANLKFLPWDVWCKSVSEEFAGQTWDHISHSPNASIAKGQRLLNYRPRFSSLQAIREALESLFSRGLRPEFRPSQKTARCPPFPPC